MQEHAHRRRERLLCHPNSAKIKAHSTAPEVALDFFCKLLHPSAEQRMTAEQALDHPYLRDCYQEMQRARRGKAWCHYYTDTACSEAAATQRW